MLDGFREFVELLLKLVDLLELHILLRSHLDQQVFDAREAGADGSDATDRLFDRVELRAKLVAVESKRRKDEQEMVDRALFGRFAKAVLLAVAGHIVDVRVRAAIQDDVLRTLGIVQRTIDVEAG